MTSSRSHEIECRVYYEDTDAAGIVFYANYLKFAERGRTEYLRAHGFENRSLMTKDNLVFVVRHLDADYLAPARLDDILKVVTEVVALKNASFAMKQTIYCRNNLLFSMTVTLACVSEHGKPVRIPDDIRSVLVV